METTDKEKRSKIIRYSVWAVVILSLTIFSALKAPEHSLNFIKDLVKDVIQFLITV